MPSLVRGGLAALLFWLGYVGVPLAHEGHDHGTPAPMLTQALAPRFEASSTEFALLGILQANELVLYVDHYASNEPISGARIELESGDHKVSPSPRPDGSYRAPAGPLAAPGEHALVISIEAGTASDLLDTTLTVAAEPAPQSPDWTSGSTQWPTGWIAGGGALVLAVAGIALARLRRPGART
jgi:hypothetical protein